ncbi:SAM-dependent methyltransferase [Rhodopseudomonas julia]|uniref:SAM-dependent methyltransferase n=1 Tax=Rhodopseudomonas julia TaxID=200617 RepID=A0ABU0C8K7_9BRAD|nr:class I SAM-dependent methyltransferase [Rhodopseudomonas julia]MDQ0326241.1 SAM-dependent methyltransferase [Rhodopseudomonas julia]
MEVVDVERQLLVALISKFADRIHLDDQGHLTMEGPDWKPIATLPILRSLEPGAGVVSALDAYTRLKAFVETADKDRLRKAKLDLTPPQGVHFVDGGDNLFYDFVNTDRTLTELQLAGAELQGRILDFGCSSGRNTAVITRAGLDRLEVFGADPVPSSIEWAKENVPGAEFAVSQQEPPLPYDEASFDLAYAKSIWTHFSPRAARAWMEEITRILKPGGHFFFTIHGPHDVANRLVFDFPRPRYPNIANGEFPDKVSFLEAVIAGLRGDGHFFRPYTTVRTQGDLGKLEGATTEDWGLMFMTTEYLQQHILPPGLELVRFTPAATAGRLDGCVVRKSSSQRAASSTGPHRSSLRRVARSWLPRRG